MCCCLRFPSWQTSTPPPVYGEAEVPHPPGSRLHSAHHAGAAQQGQGTYQGVAVCPPVARCHHGITAAARPLRFLRARSDDVSVVTATVLCFSYRLAGRALTPLKQ